MKEKIFKNISLKILSVLCAVVLWTIIVNIYDPTTSVTISNVAVQLVNTDSLTNKGYAYEVVDGSKIAVYVSGPKSVITSIKSGDVVATADLSKITAFADYADIDVKVVKDGVTINNIEVTPKTTAIKLDIENLESKEFVVKTEVTGRPASGYVILNKSVDPGNVKISGPASEIAKISYVKAVCDTSNIKASTTKKSAIVLYDAKGNEIDSSAYQMSATEVEFGLNVGVSKTVSVQCSGTDGKIAANYMITDVSVDINQVTVVASDASLLDSVTDIVIPNSAVNVDGLSESKSFSINLANYVPGGVTFTSSSVANVTVTVEKRASKHINLAIDNIKVNNVNPDMVATISADSVINVIISGTSANIANISAKDIQASVDLTNLSEGTHSVALNLSTTANCKIEGDYKVLVVIAPKVETTALMNNLQETPVVQESRKSQE